jgi:DNA modification methylase
MEINKIYQGDVLEVSRTFPDECVHCVVTSPPYWGLRDYGTAIWSGGDQKCDHKRKLARNDGGRVNTQGFHGSSAEDSNKGAINYSDICPKCGARRIDKQLGLEPTPEEYIARMVEIFREVKRVLRSDGTLWLNMGDCYAGSGGPGGDYKNGRKGMEYGSQYHHEGHGLKPKDLVGLPWMLAFALRDDGWWLRSDIVWAKPNPMPESVRDRPTKAHEYLFLLSKSKKYYYDQDAVREATKGNVPTTEKGSFHNHENDDIVGQRIKNKTNHPAGRNLRDVWTIATQPFPEAHFATFPEKLVEPCIKAGTPLGVLVLDPFMGAGTTALVARKLGRNYIGIELNPEYIKIVEKRLKQLFLF